jgi:hypothetical protein
MTNVSRRGRPRKFDPALMETIRSLHGNVHTERHRQNIAMIVGVLGILGLREGHPPPELLWIADFAGEDQGKQGAVKWAILEQLGRIARDYDADTVRRLAIEVSRLRPTAKEGAAMLREWRRDN